MDRQKGFQNLSGGRGITLNDLRDQQYSLNMQMLLAIQVHDDAARKRLEKQLAELQEQIDCLCLREYRHRE